MIEAQGAVPLIDNPLERLLVVGLLLGIAVTASASTGPVEASFSTDEPVILGGKADGKAVGGLHIPGLDEAIVDIQAAEVKLVTEWETGKHIRTPGGGEYRHVEDEGLLVKNATNAHLALVSEQENAEALFEPSGEVRVEGESLGTSFAEVLGPETLISQGGYPEEGVDTGSEAPPSYIYKSKAPLASLSGINEAHVTGSPTLFVNNASIVVTEDSRRWSTWTGTQESRTGPSGDYEIRVTRIHLSDATATLHHSSESTLLAPEIQTAVSGTVTVDDTRGTLAVGQHSIDLKGNPVELSGSGVASFAPSGSAPADSNTGHPLQTELQGEFDVLAEELPPETTSEDKTGASMPLIASALIVGGIAYASVFVQRQRASLLPHLPGTWRGALYRRMREKAFRYEDEGEEEKAARFYRGMTRLCPKRTHAWYGYAVNLLETGNPGKAVEALSDARDQIGELPLEFLELEIAAANAAGKVEHARAALIRLAEAAPDQARLLLDQVRLGDLPRDAVVRAILAGEGEHRGKNGG